MILDAAHNSIGVWVWGLHFALYEVDTHFEFALAWKDQEDVGGVQHREDEVEDEADKEELSHLPSTKQFSSISFNNSGHILNTFWSSLTFWLL